MWQRIQTAIILVAIVGVAMFAFESHLPFIALLAVAGSIALREWRVFLPSGKVNKDKITASEVLFVLMPIIVAVIANIQSSWLYVWSVSILMWLVAIKWIFQYPEKVTWFDSRIALFGAVFLTSALTAMYYLWSQSPWWLLYVFVLVWCADSGAYFVGRKFGKKKMAPKVSPNKSMEGLYGGVATGLVAVLLVSFIKLKYPPAQLIYFVVLSALTIIISVFGDLFESMLKRQADVKDSGTILPGHGGVLDRIDSLLSATPFFALGYWFMLNYIS